ncbi:hypothetical protein D3C85_1122200 [compost metagenome]
MVHLRRDQRIGNPHQLPQRLVHDADGPEVVRERRVRAELAILIGNGLPGAAAVEESVLGERPALAQRRHQFADQLAGFLLASGLAQHLVQRVGLVKGARVAGAAVHHRRRRKVVQEMGFQMHDVVRQRVGHLAIILPAAADKDDAEADVREGADHLVDPAGHAPAYIRERAFQQQHDVGGRSLNQYFTHDCQYRSRGRTSGSGEGLSKAAIRRCTAA